MQELLVRDVGHHPLFAPICLFFLRPEFGEKDERLESRRKVPLPIGASRGCDVRRVSLQVPNGASVMREGPVDVDQFIELAEGCAERFCSVDFIQSDPLASQVGVESLFGKLNNAFTVFLFELLQGQGGLSGGEFSGPPPPVDFIDHGVNLIEPVFGVVLPQFPVNQSVHGGACNLDEAVLHALKPTRRQKGHPKLKKLAPVQSVHHDIETGDQVFEVAVYSIDALEQGFGRDVGLRMNLLQLME